MAYEVLIGSVLDKIKEIESESVDSVITSPPYFGLRDYGNDEQIGLEETPEEYIQKMVDVFREVHRVLKPTGTVWLNIGDTYKNSQLMLIPHKLLIALQEDGWIIRQDIIWYKTNPMPEPVKTRCTKSHEHIFFMTKSKKYYFNHEENRVPSTDSYKGRRGKRKQRIKQESAMKDRIFDDETEYFEGMKRTRHDVWILRTLPYKEAHFAVYPYDLIEPCILTGCPPDGLVLDIFAGSGTTGGVAEKHGRNSILIELNPEYAKLIPERIKSIQGVE
jgi:site-specific DNA-methyltransferase (adenine-specific)